MHGEAEASKSTGASGTAFLGDLNAVGDITVNSPDIQFVSRAAGEVLQVDGSLEMDDGVDVIAGGFFDFQVAPTMLVVNAGESAVTFASSTVGADVNGNLGGTSAPKVLLYQVELSDLVEAGTGTILDLRAEFLEGLTSSQLGALASADSATSKGFIFANATVGRLPVDK